MYRDNDETCNRESTRVRNAVGGNLRRDLNPEPPGLAHAIASMIKNEREAEGGRRGKPSRSDNDNDFMMIYLLSVRAHSLACVCCTTTSVQCTGDCPPGVLRLYVTNGDNDNATK